MRIPVANLNNAVLLFVHFQAFAKKKAVPPLSGNQLCELALATRRSASSGPVAFRHPITRVLAFSRTNFDEQSLMVIAV
jgi:hypothetical protein